MVDKVMESYCFKDNTHGRESYGKYMDARGEEVQGGEAMQNAAIRKRLVHMKKLHRFDESGRAIR